MANRGRYPVRLRAGGRRATDWVLGFGSTAFTAIAGTTKVLLASIDVSAANTPGTIVRTRGGIFVVTGAATAGQNIIGAVGLALVSDVARAAGIGSIPGPFTDALWDGWFWYQSLLYQSQSAGASFNVEGRFYPIDSKAMRKMEGDSGLVWVVENGGANSFNIAGDIRMLVKSG